MNTERIELTSEDFPAVLDMRVKLLTYRNNNNAPLYVSDLMEYKSFLTVARNLGDECEHLLQICKLIIKRYPRIAEQLLA